MATITVDLDGASAGFSLANDPRELAEFFGRLADEMDTEDDGGFKTLMSELKGEDKETKYRLNLLLTGIVEGLKE